MLRRVSRLDGQSPSDFTLAHFTASFTHAFNERHVLGTDVAEFVKDRAVGCEVSDPYKEDAIFVFLPSLLLPFEDPKLTPAESQDRESTTSCK